MTRRETWSRLLVIVGGVLMLIGALDPLEGSVIILIGCGLVLLGTWLGDRVPGLLRRWVWNFSLIGFGVGALFVLSALGGIGGDSGRSIWWGAFILPYPVGWVLGIVSLLSRLVRGVRGRRVVA